MKNVHFTLVNLISSNGYLLIQCTNVVYQRKAGASTQGGMVRDAPWRKFGGECCDDNDAFARVYIIRYYMNTFITLHQCTFNLLFALFSTLCLKKHPRCFQL